MQALNEVNLNVTNIRHNNPLYLANLTYSFADLICGPIFYSFFFRQQLNMSSLEIIQNEVLTRTKILGNIGIEFIQIINPAKYNTGPTTLQNLIIAVSTHKMFIYNKFSGNGV